MAVLPRTSNVTVCNPKDLFLRYHRNYNIFMEIFLWKTKREEAEAEYMRQTYSQGETIYSKIVS